MDEKFDVIVAGTLITVKGDENKLKPLADKLSGEINDIIFKDAKMGKLEAAFLCALRNLEAASALEEENRALREKLAGK